MFKESLVPEQLQNTPVKSRWGRGLLFYASSFSVGMILERGNLLCTGYVWILDRVYAWLRVKIKAKSTHISLLSKSHKCIQPRSTLRCLRSSLRCVFPVRNQFDPVKKASSVMAAYVGSTAPAIRAYHSPNTETQLKLVHLSTGVVYHATCLRLKVPP